MARQSCGQRRFRMVSAALVALVLVTAAPAAHALEGPAPVDLGAATPFVILTKTGITNVPTSDITGDLGTSPIGSTAITGFSLIADSTNRFSRSAQVTGKIYAANYAAPTPTNLTTAVGNMQTAYTDAAGRTLPDFTELYAGNLSGRTLVPGLYKWSTGVLVTSTVTLEGAPDAVWIFQVAGNLTLASGARMVLSGGAQARNIFWQVAGGTGAEIGTTAHAEGNILAQKAIHLRTGATLNGRALAQTAVTLAKNRIVIPTSTLNFFYSDAVLDGYVLESTETSNVGGTQNSTATFARIGDDIDNRQYKGVFHFDTSGLPDTAVITKVTLRLKKLATVGVDPFTTHGNLVADVATQSFGQPTLQISDFQAPASALSIAAFTTTPDAGWHTAVLSPAGRTFVNRTGTTQFRVRFATADNDDFSADHVKFYSGNAALGLRPELDVHYDMP